MEEPASGVWEITDAYRGDGWGQNTRESVQEVLDFPRREGIFIENVYNSKVLVGMKDWVASGRVTGPVCYLHTGGLGLKNGAFGDGVPVPKSEHDRIYREL